MSFDALLIDTVTVYPWVAGAEDRYGNATDTWGAGVSTSARVEQLTADEDLERRDTRHTTFRVFLPASTTINALSKIEWGSLTLQVVGEPAQVADSVATQHIECAAEVFEG